MNAAAPLAPRLHPIVATAALAVTTFSLAGIAALTGVLPMSKAASATHGVAVEIAPAAAVIAVPPAPTFSVPQASAKPTAPPTSGAAPNPPSRHSSKPPAKTAASVAEATPAIAAVEIAQAPTAEQPVAIPSPPPALAPCLNCGVIESLREVAREGEGSGIGAVAGGILGGMLGKQIGGGNGNKIATVLGAVGGAYAGHHYEKSRNKTTRHEIDVRMEDGAIRTLTQDSLPAWRVGERVRIENNGLVRETDARQTMLLPHGKT